MMSSGVSLKVSDNAGEPKHGGMLESGLDVCSKRRSEGIERSRQRTLTIAMSRHNIACKMISQVIKKGSE